MSTLYVIPQLSKPYFRESYPVGAAVVFRLLRSVVVKNYDLKMLSTQGTILNYVSFDDNDNAYDQVEVEWDLGYKKAACTVMLQNILLIEDVAEYKSNDAVQKQIKSAMLEVGVITSPSVNSWEEWFTLDMELTRKLAFIKAGVPVCKVNVYDGLSLEELSSLKRYLQALEKEEK